MYWYRIYLSLGRASIIGTTIKAPQKLPQNLVADEKHTWLGENRIYLPTTVAKGCFLGVSLTESAALFKNGVFWVTNAGEIKPSLDFA